MLYCFTEDLTPVTSELSLFTFPQGTVVSFPLSVHVSGRAPFFHLELSSLDTARTGEATWKFKQIYIIYLSL